MFEKYSKKKCENSKTFKIKVSQLTYRCYKNWTMYNVHCVRSLNTKTTLFVEIPVLVIKYIICLTFIFIIINLLKTIFYPF